jgi:hypothetical protein
MSTWAYIDESMREIARLEGLNDELLAALKTSVIAIDDWLNTYAADHCNETHVIAARERISNSGGTLAYIADVQQKNRQTIAKVETRRTN